MDHQWVPQDAGCKIIVTERDGRKREGKLKQVIDVSPRNATEYAKTTLSVRLKDDPYRDLMYPCDMVQLAP